MEPGRCVGRWPDIATSRTCRQRTCYGVIIHVDRVFFFGKILHFTGTASSGTQFLLDKQGWVIFNIGMWHRAGLAGSLTKTDGMTVSRTWLLLRTMWWLARAILLHNLGKVVFGFYKTAVRAVVSGEVHFNHVLFFFCDIGDISSVFLELTVCSHWQYIYM